MLAADEYAAVDSFVPKPGQSKTTTFNKSQRKAVKKGADAVEKQDDAVWSTFTGRPSRISPLKKCLLAVTMCSNMFANAIGQVASFADPGWHGTDCDQPVIDSLNQAVETQDPSLIYVHVPFAADDTSSKDYGRLISFLTDQMSAGRTWIVADTRHTDRWTGVDPTLCQGDLGLLLQQHRHLPRTC